MPQHDREGYCPGGDAVLVVLHGWRLAAFQSELRADLADPRRGFGFLTFVAGTGVPDARLQVDGHNAMAAVLLAAGGLA